MHFRVTDAFTYLFVSLSILRSWWSAANTLKGAPALESRTEGRLVSPTTLAAGEKKICIPTRFGLERLNLDLSMVEHAMLCKSVVYIFRTCWNDSLSKYHVKCIRLDLIKCFKDRFSQLVKCREPEKEGLASAEMSIVYHIWVCAWLH